VWEQPCFALTPYILLPFGSILYHVGLLTSVRFKLFSGRVVAADFDPGIDLVHQRSTLWNDCIKHYIATLNA